MRTTSLPIPQGILRVDCSSYRRGAAWVDSVTEVVRANKWWNKNWRCVSINSSAGTDVSTTILFTQCSCKCPDVLPGWWVTMGQNNTIYILVVDGFRSSKFKRFRISDWYPITRPQTLLYHIPDALKTTESHPLEVVLRPHALTGLVTCLSVGGQFWLVSVMFSSGVARVG